MMKQSQIPTRFWLTCASLLLSFIILLVTLLDRLNLGSISLFIAPITAILTIVYHTTILIVARRRAAHIIQDSTTVNVVTTKRSPTATMWSIGIACFLCLMWATAMTITSVALGILAGDRFSDPLLGVQICVPGLVFEFGELVVMIALTVMSMYTRREEPCSTEWYHI
jgi:hypothetical protein